MLFVGRCSVFLLFVGVCCLLFVCWLLRVGCMVSVFVAVCVCFFSQVLCVVRSVCCPLCALRRSLLLVACCPLFAVRCYVFVRCLFVCVSLVVFVACCL